AGNVNPGTRFVTVDANGVLGAVTTTNTGVNVLAPIVGDGVNNPITIQNGSQVNQGLFFNGTSWQIATVPVASPIVLNANNEVTLQPGPAGVPNQTLVWNGTNWVIGPLPTQTQTQAPIIGDGTTGNEVRLQNGTADGDVLSWNGNTNAWEIRQLVTGNFITGNGSVANPLQFSDGPLGTSNQTFVWNGVAWTIGPMFTGVNTTSPITGDGSAANPVGLIPGTQNNDVLVWNANTNSWGPQQNPGWLLSGNTVGAADRLGTINNFPLNIITNNTTRAVISGNTGFVGINVATPITRLHIAGTNGADGSFIVDNPQTPLSGGPNIPGFPSGPGTRMFFHAGRSAYRMGTATGNQFDEANIGINSYAAGVDVLASGTSSFCVGIQSQATAQGSTALGKRVNTIHAGSFQIGDDPFTAGATLVSSSTNQFSMRFSGGYRFFTDLNLNVGNGVFITAGGALGSGNAGFVGIGTDNPTEKLDVVGQARIRSLTGVGNRMVITDANGVLDDAPIITYTAGPGIQIVGANNTIRHAPHTGDVTGTVNLTVTGLLGYPLAPANPLNTGTAGSVLGYNGTAWAPINGLTRTVQVTGANGSPCNLVFTNGILTSTTCP
ncbi:MAG: hypothetical protein NZ108_07050, partial [Bacteroidia bacterium]|nr:hypothetical protein [Bacteroidia bacterium]